ncbi:MAG: hypothetical protein JW801_06855 [Bacteroidales bacterium]|nr:hypothetical protein [Bacteroidales bacterium]
MSEKALRWILYISGVVCLYAFISIRIPSLVMFNGIILEKFIPEYWENTKWGELYYFSHIRHFQEKGLPPSQTKYRFTDRHPELTKADVLAFGDSFFDFSRMTTYPEQLGDSLDQKVFYARMDLPLEYLKANAYQKGEKKYLIYETAERFLHYRFSYPQNSDPVLADTSGLKKVFFSIRDFFFQEDTELKYSMLLSRSYLTTHAYSAITTLKFDLFRQITMQTPVYSLENNYYKDRPWLFGASQLGLEPGGYERVHPEDTILNYCDNIEKLSKDLKEKYNLELVFMIIPSKYTIYHNIAGMEDSKYGQFIPRMYDELRKRNIPVIDFYDEMMAQRYEKLLYFGTDTHWTEAGLHIALNETLKVFRSMEVHADPVTASFKTAPKNQVALNTTH